MRKLEDLLHLRFFLRTGHYGGMVWLIELVMKPLGAMSKGYYQLPTISSGLYVPRTTAKITAGIYFISPIELIPIPMEKTPKTSVRFALSSGYS